MDAVETERCDEVGLCGQWCSSYPERLCVAALVDGSKKSPESKGVLQRGSGINLGDGQIVLVAMEDLLLLAVHFFVLVLVLILVLVLVLVLVSQTQGKTSDLNNTCISC